MLNNVYPVYNIIIVTMWRVFLILSIIGRSVIECRRVSGSLRAENSVYCERFVPKGGTVVGTVVSRGAAALFPGRTLLRRD